MSKSTFILKLAFYSLFSICIVLGIAQIQLIYHLKYAENVDVFIRLGLPFEYFYFSNSSEFGIQGFNVPNFLWNFIIVYFPMVVLLIVRYYFRNKPK